MRLEDKIRFANAAGFGFGCSTRRPPRCGTCRFFFVETETHMSECVIGPSTEEVDSSYWCAQWRPKFDAQEIDEEQTDAS